MHTTRSVNSVFIEFTFRPSEWRVFIATVKAAHPDKDAASAILNLRQDGSPTGQRQLAGSVHDSRVPQGRRPDQYLLFSVQRINTRRDKQQDAG
ncbi:MULTISPECIES: hypothetical protein [Klebsiella/Raoultella group]|nr:MULTISPECIES: hypothetical protein [Klebsiella/Raoultella group]MDV0373435.1 hypothetical protein [Klebsiella michiganensis]MDZ1679028.1 hypothetical protein [Klebsiella pneumoniae]TYF86377.1 hypothetical protein DJ542_25175 [Klebsiella grimontii]HBX4002408.1 hypothetical protein [Klebsiella variicola]